ncbi:MAG: hypothetical protein P4L85_15525 [Paludisphaera borealis]|uniref:hypothetical protein n=1 Tax=Paludisphaera borealis TaxID=1387353 RepID=UPI002850C685|nr:hypothetical protein [Paludisphaera borealis]MDR3620762.1 hypothetical protein [Paludisphaera borealis]
MIARLWWKEARQVWPVWALLAAAGLGLQALVGWYWGDAAGPGGYVHIALVLTMMYLFLIAAAVFAGERENRTLGLLDAIPAERWRVWTAKASFALATTAALGLLLWLGARIFGVSSSEWLTGGGVTLVWGLAALGWGLLWSSLLGNALFAAVLAMTSLSVSLLGLVNLNLGPTTLESTPSLLIVALLTTAASALAFQLGGPPRWAPRRRVRPATVAATPEIVDVEPRRLSRIWPYAVTRLVWETLREVRSALWVLVAVGVVAPLGIVMSSTRNEVTAWVWLSMSVTAIVTGVSAFNGENRGRTNRFLLQHGARPGVVWTVKVLIWWSVAALTWWIASFPLARPAASPHEPWLTYDSLVLWAASGLTIGFAASVLCGMVFRRGITAGLIALIVCILLYMPIGALVAAGAFYPWHLVYIPIPLLAVSWAWSGDWLLDRPGVAKWARLGLYSAVVATGLTSAYIANRVWAVPTLPPAQAERTFQFARIAAPVHDDDNAAPLYREAARLFGISPIPATITGSRPWDDFQGLLFGDWDASDPKLAEWLDRIEPALAMLRKGARMPACQYDDLRKVTLFTLVSEPPTYTFLDPPVLSARVRLARGDLKGAWTEIETLQRMARQYSHSSSPWSYLAIEPAAIGLAMQWAADPRQTTETLEAARTAWKNLPEIASKADRARIAALIFQNTLATPRADLADNLFFQGAEGRKKTDPFTRLQYDIQTTPWEIERARKVFDLLAAASIQELGRNPNSTPAASRFSPPYQWPVLNIEDGGKPSTILPEELYFLAMSTRLTNQAQWNWTDTSRDQNNDVARRALDLVFRLRLWQTRHDGALPHALNELPTPEGEPDGWPLDPYANKPFGYLPSQGQHLLPLGSYGPITNLDRDREGKRLRPTDGCMLLYSVGPDVVDDRATKDLDWYSKGDIIFPLKDGVKPPSETK